MEKSFKNILALTIIILVLLASCRSTEEDTVIQEENNNIAVPLDDGGFRNIGTSYPLTPEEWARLMGYQDITERLNDEPENQVTEIPESNLTQEEPIVLDSLIEQEENEEAGEPDISTIQEPDVVLIEDDDHVSDMRILNEPSTQEQEDSESVPESWDDEPQVHLAGEEGETILQPAEVIEKETVSSNNTDIRVIETEEEDLEEEGPSPEIIAEMAEKSSKRPGQAVIATFIRDHYAFIFLFIFGILAVILFVSMSRYAATGDEEEAKKVTVKRKVMKAENEIQKLESELNKPIPGKNLVFTEMERDEAPTRLENQQDDETLDELELEPVDDDPIINKEKQ